MQNIIYIQVETLANLADLQLDRNFICQVAEDGGIYRGDPEAGSPIKIFDNNNRQPISGPARYVSSADDLLETDFLVEVSGTFTLTLFSADGSVPSGQLFYINNSGAGTVTIDPISPETIQGALSYSLAAGKSVCLTPNVSQTDWLVLSSS